MQALAHPLVQIQELQLRPESLADLEARHELARRPRCRSTVTVERFRRIFFQPSARSSFTTPRRISSPTPARSFPSRSTITTSLPCGLRRASAIRSYREASEAGRIAASMAAHPTLHDGLEALRDDRASEPAAVARRPPSRRREFGTPLYVYDKATITGQFRAFWAAFAPRFPKLRIHYALKANTNGALVSLLRAEGAAAEVVSLGEILTALRAGYRGDEILFTSSSKGPEEIAKAVEIGAVVNVDSRDELEQVAAARRARRAEGADLVPDQPRCRPRHAPPDQHRHRRVEVRPPPRRRPRSGGLRAGEGAAVRSAIAGVHCHIGSQIIEIDGYDRDGPEDALLRPRAEGRRSGSASPSSTSAAASACRTTTAKTVMSPEALAAALRADLEGRHRGRRVRARALAGAGPLPRRAVGLPRHTREHGQEDAVKTFVNVDAGSNTLLRPAHLRRRTTARASSGRRGRPRLLDVAGDVCETGDILAAERAPAAAEGRRPRRLPRRRRLRLLDGVDVQRPAASGRRSSWTATTPRSSAGAARSTTSSGTRSSPREVTLMPKAVRIALGPRLRRRSSRRARGGRSRSRP